MPETTAIKFTKTGTSIEFTVDEVASETLDFLQDMQVNVSQAQAPTVYYKGAEYKALTVNFVEWNQDTADKIAQLKATTEEFNFYYAYASSPASSVKVIPMIDDDLETWVFGERGADVMHTMQFLVSG